MVTFVECHIFRGTHPEAVSYTRDIVYNFWTINPGRPSNFGEIWFKHGCSH